MKRKMLSKGDSEVDELERDFLNEVCHMRMDIAYQRLLKTRTHKDAKRVKERGVAIEELYEQVEKECTDEGKKLLFMNVYTHVNFDDAEEELRRMEEFRKAQAEIEKKNPSKPTSQVMFKVI